MYKCAIVAVGGGRARGHADAYRHIERGELVAVSTRRQDKLDEFADLYNVPARYTDYRAMFNNEKPDLVHVNTPPNVRLEIMQAAEEAGVPSLIIEKPLGIQGEDYLAMRDFSRNARVKVAINHQLHFHPRRYKLQQIVKNGEIGEIRFIEASARMNLAYQGTHALQAIGAFMPDAVPTSVFGQLSGGDGLEETPRQHFAPDQCIAAIAYDNGVSAMLRCGTNSPAVIDGPISKHKRVAVFGTRGHIDWTMHSWETGVDGKVEAGTHEYPQEDILGQAAMTEAMFDWLEDNDMKHPLNLTAALQDLNIILGIYTSAIDRRPVDLPVDPAPALISKLRQILVRR